LSQATAQPGATTSSPIDSPQSTLAGQQESPGRGGPAGNHQSHSGLGTSTYDAKPSFVPTSLPTSRGSESGIAVSFRLDRRGPVRFVFTKVGSVCRVVGSFVVRGHAGANSVPIRASVGHRRLRAGTYWIFASHQTQTLFAIRIVVAGGRIVARELVAATAGPCGGPLGTTGPLAPSESRLLSAFAPGSKPKPPAAATGSQPAASRHQALGAQFAQSAGRGLDLTRLSVLAAAGLALMLLGAATLPNELVPASPLGFVLVRRRVEIALAGVSTLFAAVVAYLVYGR
jgi:hypothetical protein